MLDTDHADAYFNMAIIHQEHAADESIGIKHYCPYIIILLFYIAFYCDCN